MQILEIDINKIQLDSSNPRTTTTDQINIYKKILSKYGFAVPLIISNDHSQDTVLENYENLKKKSKEELVQKVIELQNQLEEKSTIIRENKPLRNDIHPTMKPIKLLARLMANSSKKGWNVIDLFGGSGSTLMTAEQLGRKAFLMEYDPKYCDVIVKRFISTGNTKITLQRGSETFDLSTLKEKFEV